MEDLCGITRKLIHRELRRQDLETLTYKDIRNISRNTHKARSTRLLPLPTDTEETHDALTFRHRASCIKGQAFHYSPENAFYIFNQQIRVCFII